MNIDFEKLIGAYVIDTKTGRWKIVGASDKTNAEFNEHVKENSYKMDSFDFSDMTRLEIDSVPITSENYSNMRKQIRSMPKHCYGTDYGFEQVKKIKKELKTYFIEKNVSESDLKNYFKDCCRDMRVILAQERRTTGLEKEDNRQILLDTYEQFRMTCAVISKLANDEEGKKLAVENGWTGGDKDWVYYNSYFFYEFENAQKVLKEATKEIAEEWELDDVDTTERDEDRYLSYSGNFHQVWKTESEGGVRICSIENINVSPPSDFRFFFRECINRDGDTGFAIFQTGDLQEKRQIIFDIYGDGEQQHFPQSLCLSDLFSNDYEDDISTYLDNFYVFSRYFGTVKVISGNK